MDEQQPQEDVLEYQPFVPLNNLLDIEVPEDAALIEVLKQYIADQPEEFQGIPARTHKRWQKMQRG